ncbi:MAG: hypothetical protein RIG82_09570 [Phycisphaeraceae bacterium]
MVKMMLSCGALLVCVSVMAGCETMAVSDQATADAQYGSAVEAFNARTWSNEMDSENF